MTRKIEEILEQSPLRKPGDSLGNRMEDLWDDLSNDLDQKARPAIDRWRWAMSITTLAAAMAIVAILWRPWSTGPAGLQGPQPSPKVVIDPPSDFAPIRFEQTQVDVTPGDVFLVDRQPVRLLHRQSIDLTEWVDESNNVRIELTVPKEDYFIVPVKVD
jgi:hypothetical protein